MPCARRSDVQLLVGGICYTKLTNVDWSVWRLVALEWLILAGLGGGLLAAALYVLLDLCEQKHVDVSALLNSMLEVRSRADRGW